MSGQTPRTFSEKFERVFHQILPSPFTLAVGLTFFVLLLALFFFKPSESSFGAHTLNVVGYWSDGIWKAPLLVFAYQMMLILVLGHVIALSPPAERFISLATKHCTSTPKAAAIVTFVCVALGFINWGLTLIFGAVFARKVAENATRKGLKINYPLIAACGYTGMMVWHGGLSGSSVIKAAEPGHLSDLVAGRMGELHLSLSNVVSFSETVFSPMNISASIALLIVLPFGAYALGKNSPSTRVYISHQKPARHSEIKLGWAEKFDYKWYPSFFLGLVALVAAVIIASNSVLNGNYNFINPNFINLTLLGLGLILHGSLAHFAGAVEEAIKGAASILIQFPLYFGILGVMQNAGIVAEISQFFVSISSSFTYPIWTFLSAGFVNILVPSGGGQWMVQGPIIIEASQELNLPLGKSIMAMAYGDQITNMLQPFWALPLLSITGLKARDILPYTLYFMVIGILIFGIALIFF